VKRIIAAVAAVLAVAAVAVTVGLTFSGGSDQAQAAQRARKAASSRTAAVNRHVTVTGDYALSAADEEALAFMREEEKLARDVYDELATLYSLRTFGNISTSEAKHMAAVKDLLNAYGLDDPAAGTAQGEFDNDGLQTLYDSLVAEGRASLTAALEAGVAIEKTDIEDLRQAIAETDNPEVKAVLTNLLNASYKHLSTFERQLARFGG
jgi:hypothetical protein